VVFHDISTTMSSFFGSLHPAAALYMDSPDENRIHFNFSAMREIFNEYRIKSYTVAEGLEQGGIIKLRKLALNSLTYIENKEKPIT
jgi:hypothetical protein